MAQIKANNKAERRKNNLRKRLRIQERSKKSGHNGKLLFQSCIENIKYNTQISLRTNK